MFRARGKNGCVKFSHFPVIVIKYFGFRNILRNIDRNPFGGLGFLDFLFVPL